MRHRPDWLDLLDGQERRRAGLLARTPAGDVYVTSRGAQRLIGSRYLGVPAREVTADRDCEHCGARHGRPRFRSAAVDHSVSHTDRWLMMAVTGGGRVGADIENVTSMTDADALARTVLTAGEARHVRRLPAADRAGWLLRAWTRKEAAMKLTGLGLLAPPDLVDVSGPTVSAAGVPRWPAGPIHLTGLAAPEGHAASLATGEPLVTVRRFRLPEDGPGAPQGW